MTQVVITPKRAQERQLITNLKRAWSLRENDQYAELTDARGRRLTYPRNKALHQAQLARLASLGQQRRAAQRALVTPNVCTALPLAGFTLVPKTVIRFQ